MSPARKRRAVQDVCRRLGPGKVSERRACRVLGQSRGTQRYVKRRPADEARLLAEDVISRFNIHGAQGLKKAYKSMLGEAAELYAISEMDNSNTWETIYGLLKNR